MIAAVYCRKSTDQSGVSDDQRSVARQLEHAKAYAARKGWTVANEHVYVDDGISGGEFSARPGYMRLLNALKPRSPFQILIVSEVSRLGREMYETGAAMKQLSQAGVRIFAYLDDREVVLDSAIDKFLLSALNFGAELEKEKAGQRSRDKAEQQIRAGHVAGGRTFGYDNVRTESHVERRINETEAAVVRRIFRLSAEGHGVKAIAKALNEAGAPSPRAQLGRSQTWAPSSVREVLMRDLYRGVLTWNKSKKRDRWGAQRQSARPAGEWISMPAPQLAIVTEAEWQAAHARLMAARCIYLRGTKGSAFGRPALGAPSKYLLTNLARCGRCGSGLHVRSGSHGKGRRHLYACSGYHLRGKTVCANGADVPMEDADAIVIEALLDDVLDLLMLRDAVDVALGLVAGNTGSGSDPVKRLKREISRIEAERDRYVAAIATAGNLDGLVRALQEREARLMRLRKEGPRGDRRSGASRARGRGQGAARAA